MDCGGGYLNLERSSKPVSRVPGPVQLFQLLSFVTSLHLLPASFNRKKPLYVLTGLLRVRLPPFGNTIFESTIPLSVTFIMSQFGRLLRLGICASIWQKAVSGCSAAR